MQAACFVVRRRSIARIDDALDELEARPAVDRNEVILSPRERRFHIEFRPPTLDGLVADLLSSSFNRLDGETVDQMEDVCRDAFGHLQHPTQ